MKPYYNSQEGQVYHGNALGVLRSMPSESVQMCVTSPPYWGLRDYGVDGQLGLEKTPEEYIEKMVQTFRELRRVLRNDGTLWLNMGDSYAGGGGFSPNSPANLKGSLSGKVHYPANTPYQGGTGKLAPGLKPKDLCGIPWMLAFALRADGWYLRSAMPWVKRSAMPESVTDRPASALEYMFLLTKRARYFFDMDAVRKPHTATPFGGWEKMKGFAEKSPENPCAVQSGGRAGNNPAGRNFRNTDLFFESLEPPFGAIFANDEMVGLDINPQAMKEAHFATFPRRLPEVAILAGTSEKGCCVSCKSPWVRVVERTIATSTECPKTQAAHEARGGTGKATGTVGKSGGGRIDGSSKTIGWKPSCECNAETEPCTVIDPFFGSGTTAIVAHKHGRKFMGIELSQAYLDEIAIPRIEKATKQLKLFN